MRLTTLLLLIGVLHVSARINAQKVTIEAGKSRSSKLSLSLNNKQVFRLLPRKVFGTSKTE